MASILEPIFVSQNPVMVFILSFAMVMIAVFEVYFSRSTHHHSFMFATVLLSIFSSVFTVGFLGNYYSIQAKPWYKPTQFIPVLGMLIGNSMSSVSIGLNTAMNEIISNKEVIELQLAFGSTAWETSVPICINAIKLGLLPILNSQSVMGLVSIPGMMTGQILGGVSVKDAVYYQLIVMFMMVASCTLSTVFCVIGAVNSVFDLECRLRLDKISKRKSWDFSWDKIKQLGNRRRSESQLLLPE